MRGFNRSLCVAVLASTMALSVGATQAATRVRPKQVSSDSPTVHHRISYQALFSGFTSLLRISRQALDSVTPASPSGVTAPTSEEVAAPVVLESTQGGPARGSGGRTMVDDPNPI